MRTRPFVILGAVVAAAAATAVPAAHTSALDTPVRGPFRVDALRDQPCSLWRTVEHIARFSGLRIGFEHLTDCRPQGRARQAEADGIVLDGWTPRQALDFVVARRPDFAWRQVDGVIVLRPVRAWADVEDLLHRPVKAFAVTQAHPHHALHALAGAAEPSLFNEHEDLRLSASRAPLFDPPVTIDSPIDFAFTGGTVMAALNALAGRAGAQWELGYGGRPRVTLWSADFDGGVTTLGLEVATLRDAR